MEILNNIMTEMNPAIQQTPEADFNRQDKSSPDKTEFASLINNEYSKSTDRESQNEEIHSKSDIKEDDGSNINNEIHDTGENKERMENDDIGSDDKDDKDSDKEAATEKGLKTSVLLSELMIGYMIETGNISQVSSYGGTSETTDIREGGKENGSALLNGLKAGTLLNDLVSSHVSGNEAGAESGEADPDSHGENGLKMGEMLKEMAGRPDEKDINGEADDPEVDGLIFKKETSVKDETKNEVLSQMTKNHADDKTSVMDKRENINKSEGLNNTSTSGTSDQYKQESGTGDNAFNFAKGPHNSKNDVEANNGISLNNSNTSFENTRSVQGTSALHTAKIPGAQELLDKVIYVIKGNSRMGVSVEHENLGKLNISLSMEKGMVNVHINTSDHAIREIIENNIQQIVNTLNKDGVSVGEFSVGLRDPREHETNKFSLKNGQGRGITAQEMKKEHRHRGLVNIFA